MNWQNFAEYLNDIPRKKVIASFKKIITRSNENENENEKY